MIHQNIGSFNPLTARPAIQVLFPTEGDYGIYTRVEERPNIKCSHCGLDAVAMEERYYLKKYLGLIGRIGSYKQPHPYSQKCIGCNKRIPWQDAFGETNVQFFFTFPTGPHSGVWSMASEITVITDVEYERLKAYADPKRTFFGGQNNQHRIMRQRLPTEQWSSSQDACPQCDGPKSRVSKLCIVCYVPQTWPVLSKDVKDQRIADVMRMRFVEGMPRGAIGIKLGLSATTIHVYEVRGLHRLGIVSFKKDPYRLRSFKELLLEVQTAAAEKRE